MEAAAPQRVGGVLTGVLYAVTYIGVGLPVLLTAVGSVGASAVLVVMAVPATVAAVGRAVRLRPDAHRQN